MSKKLCKKLNKLLPVKSPDDVNKINAWIYKEYLEYHKKHDEYPKWDLYFDRELFINCGCDNDKVRSFSLHSGETMFYPSDDPDEHPGIVVRYKDTNRNSNR